MKITSVDVIRLTQGASPVSDAPWHPTVLRVNTDEGISGIGEVGLSYSSARHSAVAAARDFAPIIIGADPMNIESIWQRLYRDTFWGLGAGGFEFGAISAIDIALWDIKGKALGVPVHQLLGGLTNPRLRTYASQLQLGWGPNSKRLTSPDEYAQATVDAMSEGYSAVKVNPIFFDAKGDWFNIRYTGMLDHEQLMLGVRRIEAMREAGGENLDIILELHALTDVNTAIQICRALEPSRIFYAEEVVSPDNPDNTATVARAVQIPLAAGEREYGRSAYKRFLQNESLRVIQPDLGNCGGISEAMKIAAMASAYDVSVQAHVCGGPVAIAAALQFEAVLPNFLIHEHHAVGIREENRRLCEFDYQPVGGYFEVPQLPGLGQELSAEALKTAEIFVIR